MSKRIILSAIAVTLLGSAAVLAQAPPAPPPGGLMNFFVTSATPAGTGNLGGLAGADRICQDLAAGVGAGNRTWHAYLSQEARPNQAPVNARGRIGAGPWYNEKGQMIAGGVADLHGDQQRDRNGLRQASVLDEKGNIVPCTAGGPPGSCQHDIMTGSDSDGRAFSDGIDHTCNNWTSDQNALPRAANAPADVPADRARAMLGHSDRGGQGAGNTSWNAAHMSQGCTKQALINTGGSGRIYCFAIN
jgi:hypothetical protein